MFVGNKVVAASTNLTLHLAMETESSSTKDDDSDWEVVTPVGLAWDAQVDALVTNGNFVSEEAIKCTDTLSGVTGYTKYYATAINLRNGDTLSVDKPQGSTKAAIIDSSFALLVGGASTDLIISYTATADCTVYVACSSAATELNYKVVDSAQNADSLLDILEGKTLVTLKFDVTSGIRNRVHSSTILTGDAYITDWEITAANRTNSVYRVSFTGDGELTKS